jgi:hypothetical protein
MRRDVRVRTPTGQQFAGKNITKLPPAAPAIQKKNKKKVLFLLFLFLLLLNSLITALPSYSLGINELFSFVFWCVFNF